MQLQYSFKIIDSLTNAGRKHTKQTFVTAINYNKTQCNVQNLISLCQDSSSDSKRLIHCRITHQLNYHHLDKKYRKSSRSNQIKTTDKQLMGQQPDGSIIRLHFIPQVRGAVAKKTIPYSRRHLASGLVMWLSVKTLLRASLHQTSFELGSTDLGSNNMGVQISDSAAAKCRTNTNLCQNAQLNRDLTPVRADLTIRWARDYGITHSVTPPTEHASFHRILLQLRPKEYF